MSVATSPRAPAGLEQSYEYVEAWGMAAGSHARVLRPRSVEQMAACFELARRGVNERFVPWRWSLVGLALRSIPSFLFRKLNI